ncbi:MAG: MoxR-like ATPase [Acidimicrobiia bacterium]|nr:MoxR-like ATPase [Acidimicrobiia bacterium]
MDISTFARSFAILRENIESFIRGKREIVELALVCLLSEGHLLIEDVPGVGKTSLAKALALSIDGSLQRIQFTPDLLPSDVTGVPIFDPETRRFVFHEGPIFANVVVADEINRASPKTQAALLEVMEEYHVTVDARSYAVPRPFMVVATQNPIELEGTYPLPEAQIDRFMMRTSVGYPGRNVEVDVITDRLEGRTADDIQACLGVRAVQEMIDFAGSVVVAPAVKRYIVELAAATRDRTDLRLGVSPRGAIALAVAARVRAASQGREYVVADDIKTLAAPVLEHRMLVRAEAQLRGGSPRQVLNELLAQVPVPEQWAAV